MRKLIFPFVCLLLAIPCRADTIIVDQNGFADFNNIQDAINIADNGDTIKVQPGIYTGDGNRDIDFLGKIITVRSIDPNDPNVVAVTVIDCNGSEANPHQGFYFHSNEDGNSVLDGFTVTNGYQTYGGAIYCDNNSSPTIANCVISFNAALIGGGICCRHNSSPSVTNCVIRNNSAAQSGGIHLDDASATIANCLITGNSAPSRGSGVHCINNTGTTIKNCVISNNSGTAGGGLFLIGSITVHNCLIVGNSAEGGASYDGGGGIACWDSVLISNCTIANNTTEYHAGGVMVYNNTLPQIIDSIVWGNTNPDLNQEIATYSCIGTGSIAGIGNISADPKFASGQLGDYYLSQIAGGQPSDSPCIDAGSDLASNVGMDNFTTCTTEITDTGTVDLGYHYPNGIFVLSADVDENWHVDLVDFAILAADWLVCSGPYDSNELPGDIFQDGCVNIIDLGVFVDFWLHCYLMPAGSPSPSDDANAVSSYVVLSWLASDGASYHDVYLGTDVNAVVDADHFSAEFMGTIPATSFDPCMLELETKYYWRVDEVGQRCTKEGEVWSFTTIAFPAPGQASSPNPTDGEPSVSITTDLSWLAGSDTTSHDVYFGTTAPGEFQGNQTDATFDLGTLEYETTYYWRINEVGLGGTSIGAIWSFTTAPAPGQASSPNPTDTETGVDIYTYLSWTAGSDTTSFDVYFGTNPTPDVNEFWGNLWPPSTMWQPGPLDYETTYYWRIDALGPGGTTTGVIWSFTTMIDPNLVGRWWFNETSGNIAYDSSGNENHGTLFDGIGNGLVWEPDEGALNFDGTNNLSRVSIPTTQMTTTAGTFTIWANLAEPQNREDGRNGSGYFFGLDGGSIDKILLYMNNGDTQLDMKIGNHLEADLTTLSTETWYHIALTWDAGTYALYLNGSPLDSGTYSGLSSLPSAADIGNNGDSHKQSLHGLVGEVQVYDRALSDEEIQQLYQDGQN